MNPDQFQWRHSVADTCNKQAVKNLKEKGTIHNSFPSKYKSKLPTIWSNTRGICTLNYKKYLKTCKVTRKMKIDKRYQLNNWVNHTAKISNTELILKRWELEKKIQDGLMATIQAQILDSLAMSIKYNDEEEKMSFDSDKLENISFLLDKFTNSMGIVPETKAVSTYNERYIQSVKKIIKLNVPGIPQQVKNQILDDLNLIAKAEALSEIHGCKLYNYADPVCLNEDSEIHKKLF